MKMRIETGWDIHRLAKGRKLLVDYLEISFYYELIGHSDSDVLVHSIADLLFYSLGLHDIGQ